MFADNPDIGDRVQALWKDKRYNAALDVMRNMPRVDEKNIARRNVGDLQFEDVGAEWGLDESGVTHGAVVVDLDRDGDKGVDNYSKDKPAVPAPAAAQVMQVEVVHQN